MSSLQKLVSFTNGNLLRIGIIQKGNIWNNGGVYKLMSSTSDPRIKLFEEDDMFVTPFQRAIIDRNYEFLEKSKKILTADDITVVLNELSLCPKACMDDEYVENYISFIKNKK